MKIMGKIKTHNIRKVSILVCHVLHGYVLDIGVVLQVFLVVDLFSSCGLSVICRK